MSDIKLLGVGEVFASDDEGLEPVNLSMEGGGRKRNEEIRSWAMCHFFRLFIQFAS